MKQLLPSERLRVVTFFSGNASALKYILEIDRSTPPYSSDDYDIVGAFTDNKDAPGIKMVKKAGIKLECLDFHDWRRLHNVKTVNLKARQKYFKEVSKLIKPFKGHLIMLSGFMLIITDPLLKEYRGRIVNIHPANLAIRDENGKRKYIGKNAVAKVIAAGKKEIRATTHFVTDKIDEGPIIHISNPISIKPDDTPKILQERLKEEREGYLYEKTLRYLARYAKLKINNRLAWNIIFSRSCPDLEASNILLRSCIR